MNKLITIIFCLMLLTACKSAPESETLPLTDPTLPAPPAEEPIEEPGPESADPSTEPVDLSYQATADTCNSLCQKDSEAYCLTERTITVNDEQKTGTCRSFTRDKIAGFNRCEGFCVEYGKIGEKEEG